MPCYKRSCKFVKLIVLPFVPPPVSPSVLIADISLIFFLVVPEDREDYFVDEFRNLY